ncbi:MAG: DUF1275 family protein [Phycisphaeraceae bacterium]|nr:DUF1275 family protein [Phycisphaeraceae bacterium]MBX3405601.1 DUF1275 family protein [Phycisphaeraceae bacterium]
MFIVQAHSFTQQARLAITLAWVAGYTNIVALLTCGHVTSHVTGTASDLGKGVATGTWGLAAFSLWLLAAFFIGAVLSGMTTEFGRRRNWESIYVLPMAIEAVLLALFGLGVELHEHGTIERGAPLYLMTAAASMAMGLQNATITRISNGVVRTTHVTGVLTDLGLETAQMLLWLKDRGRNSPPVPARALIHSARHHPTAMRLVLLLSIVASFALGAGLGTAAYESMPRLAMVPPVLFLAWIIYQDVTRPIAEVEPSDLVGAGGLGLDPRLAVFHLRRDAARHGVVHRMPNLLAWADRLHDATDVVVLDLEQVSRIDANSVLELRAVLARMRDQGRSLILAGLSHEQVEQIRAAGAGDALDPREVCPDLELAIAKGLNILGAKAARHGPG